jgi:DNA ligase-1
MNPNFRPLLGIGYEKLEEVRFPVLATPKFDGIRCVTVEAVPLPGEQSLAVCRSLKPVPNDHIRSLIQKFCPPGCDGEIMTYTGFRMDPFSRIQSEVMSNRGGTPKFQYHIFDWVPELVSNLQHLPHNGLGYWDRIMQLMKQSFVQAQFVSVVLPTFCNNLGELEAFEQKCVGEGYEGVCFRPLHSPYKFGRSTPKQQILVKMKRFEDAEAVVIDMYEEMGNNNPSTLNELGYAERSSHKANMVGKGRMGKLWCCPIGGNMSECFKIGTGFTADQREDFWARKSEIIGQIVKYKHQLHGRKDKPRIPVFVGFRHPTDMDVVKQPNQAELPL